MPELEPASSPHIACCCCCCARFAAFVAASVSHPTAQEPAREVEVPLRFRVLGVEQARSHRGVAGDVVVAQSRESLHRIEPGEVAVPHRRAALAVEEIEGVPTA